VSLPDVFHWNDLRRWTADAPLQLAVLGDPVSHSASPPMHMAALKACGLPHAYGRIHINPSDFKEAIHKLAALGFIGVNLTIPHKTAILPLLDAIDPHARIMGAVNTVVFNQGRLTGFNTDGHGLVRAISEDFGVALGDLRPLILGAGGGAGRAIALQCAIEGCSEIILVNRTLEKAKALAEEIQRLPCVSCSPPKVIVLQSDSPELVMHAPRADIILQCSSLGMSEGDPSPISDSLLRGGQLVYDTIYSRETRLVKDAKSQGIRTSNGLSMLLHQGALAFEIWFARTAPVDAMRNALLDFRSQKQ
jgi:shikimate dehydrogenase